MQKAVSKPTIKRRDMDAVLNCLVDESIGPGEYTDLLTKQMASYLGVAGGLALREYRRCVELAFDAAGLQPGANVLLSALAHVVYAEVVEERGLQAIFSDVDRETGILSYESVDSAGEDEISLMAVEAPFGVPPDSERLQGASLPIIEDVSRSLGSSSNGDRGHFVVMSLEEDGVVTAGGGALVLARTRRGVGSLNSSSERLSGLSRLGNINAALATVQLKHIEELTDRRRAIAAVYARSANGGSHQTPTAVNLETLSHVVFPVIVDGSRKETEKYAKSNGVATAPLFENSILVRRALDGSLFPNAQALALKSLLFPLYPMLKRDEVERIAKVLATLP